MSNFDDLFVDNVVIDDTDDLDNLVENFPSEEQEDDNNEQTNEAGDDDANKTTVQPKVKRARTAQPRLNADRLKGPRGLAHLESFYTGMKFKGKGKETEDLNRVMQRLAHWCHRLYPKFQFDDCLNKIETLGSKKVVQTYVKKIRLGMVDEESDLVLPPEPEEMEDEPNVMDEFDELLDQQIARFKTNTNESHSSNTLLTDEQKEAIDKNRLLAQQKLKARQRDENLTQTSQSENVSTSNQSQNTEVRSVSPLTLTEEQMERILRNRQIAEQKRLERYKASQMKSVENTESMAVSSSMSSEDVSETNTEITPENNEGISLNTTIEDASMPFRNEL